ncbi:MAG: hypothetical protein ACR652_00770 [Methylocystis sp.]|uniref:hypothetical protein n=1 Tax=Methylocystis sp. TaxID=1911079 RepID=UPI003DA569E8
MIQKAEKAAGGTAALPKKRQELSNSDPAKIGSERSHVKANSLLAARRCAGDLQRLARAHVHDHGYPWRKWACFVANLLLTAAPGDHVFEQTERSVSGHAYDRTTLTKTRTKVVRWPQVSAAVVLCYGAHRLFDRPDQAPPEILAAVKQGVADALSSGRRVRYTASDIGRALGVTAAEKLAAEAWSVEAVDVTSEEWAEIMRHRRNEKQRARRRAKGMPSIAQSIAAQARALGIKPNTLRTHLRRQKARAEKVGGDVPFVKPPNNKKTRKASRTGQPSASSAPPAVGPQKATQRRQPPVPPCGGRGGEVFARAADGSQISPAVARAWQIFSPTMGWAIIAARDLNPQALQRMVLRPTFAVPEVVRAFGLEAGR